MVDEPLDRRLHVASPDRTLRSAYFCGSLAVLIEKLKSYNEALCFRLGPLNSGPCGLHSKEGCTASWLPRSIHLNCRSSLPI